MDASAPSPAANERHTIKLYALSMYRDIFGLAAAVWFADTQLGMNITAEEIEALPELDPDNERMAWPNDCAYPGSSARRAVN